VLRRPFESKHIYWVASYGVGFVLSEIRNVESRVAHIFVALGRVGRRPLLCAQDPQVFCALYSLAVITFSSLYSFLVSLVWARNAESDVLAQLRFCRGTLFSLGSCVGVGFGAPVIAMA